MKIIKELIDIESGLVDKAIKDATEKHGNEIDGYVDYNDLFLNEKQQQK